jgi:hypothetical protein
MILAMQQYDQIGKIIWRDFYQRHVPAERADSGVS